MQAKASWPAVSLPTIEVYIICDKKGPFASWMAWKWNWARPPAGDTLVFLTLTFNLSFSCEKSYCFNWKDVFKASQLNNKNKRTIIGRSSGSISVFNFASFLAIECSAKFSRRIRWSCINIQRCDYAENDSKKKKTKGLIFPLDFWSKVREQLIHIETKTPKNIKFYDFSVWHILP